MVEILPPKSGEAQEGYPAWLRIFLPSSKRDDYETRSSSIHIVCGEVLPWHGTHAFTMLLKEAILRGFWKDEKPYAWETGATTPLWFFKSGK